jgi:hypothetical protein
MAAPTSTRSSTRKPCQSGDRPGVLVPSVLRRQLLERARVQIAILVYAALFLPEQQLDLVDVLRSRVAAGCRVGLGLGDPTSPKLIERGQEQFGLGIVSRAELVLVHYTPLSGCPRVDVRVHGTTLYNSIYRSIRTCPWPPISLA